MRGFTRLMSVVVLAGTALAASAGDVLYEQLPVSQDELLSVASQEFSDAPSFSITAADDFFVPDGPGWRVTDLNTSFTTENGSGLPADGVRWTIYANDGGSPGVALVQLEGGTYDVATGLANIDLDGTGDAIDLATGAYWVSSQIIGDIGLFGQEFQLASADGVGTANFRWNNPGGAFGFPGSWIDANGTTNPDTNLPFSDVTNLAFGISGSIVPEPATLALLGVGFIAALRRRNR